MAVFARLVSAKIMELNNSAAFASYKKDAGNAAVPSKNERVELAMKIMKYRQAARLTTSDDETRKRITELVAELEKKLREIDE
jgi:hypothetical protein